MTRSSLFRADLSEADLRRATLSLADLTNANLSGANLIDTFLFSATLFTADLRKSNLSGSFLSRANLSNANLSDSIISNANLSYADIFNAKLLSSTITGYVDSDLKYHNLTCSKVDFTNASIESEGLIDYLRKNGSENLDGNEKLSAEEMGEKTREKDKPDFIEVIRDPVAKKMGFKLLQSNKEEIMITISSADGLPHDLSGDHVIQILEEAKNYARIKFGSPIEIAIERH
jgi:hypothetical protein